MKKQRRGENVVGRAKGREGGRKRGEEEGVGKGRKG